VVTVTHISELGFRLLLGDEELLLPCFVSVVSFLWLAWSVGGYNPQVASVFMADIVALAGLIIGVVAHVYVQHRGQRFVAAARLRRWLDSSVRPHALPSRSTRNPLGR
jgi:hypothetical protein